MIVLQLMSRHEEMSRIHLDVDNNSAGDDINDSDGDNNNYFQNNKRQFSLTWSDILVCCCKGSTRERANKQTQAFGRC